MTNTLQHINDIEMENTEETNVCQELSEHEKMVCFNVYHNDYIMEKIISELPTNQYRWKLDEVSSRFQDLVREAKWKNVEPSFEKLVVYAPGGASTVAVSLGTIRKFIKSEDFSNELNTILWKSLIFKRYVKSVEYGTSGYERLTLTRDLMEYLDNFSHLRNLVLKFAKTDKDAIAFLVSDECRFKHRIENLSIRDMNYDTWISHLINKKLKTLSIRIRDFSIASVILQKINQLELNLDTIDIEVSAFGFGDIGQQVEVINGFSKRCIHFNLTFYNNLKLATHISQWTNIRSLIIDTGSFRNLTDLPMVLKNIKHLEQLERLTIFERMNSAAFDSLRKGIQDLEKLKYLNITDHSLRREFGVIQPLFEILPLSLEEIHLDKFIWESGAIARFCGRSFKNLKKLTIRRPCRIGAQTFSIFELLISRFQSLEQLHYSDNIGSESIDHIIQHPNLKDVKISVSRDLPIEMELALRNKFNIHQYICVSDYIIMHLNKGDK